MVQRVADAQPGQPLPQQFAELVRNRLGHQHPLVVAERLDDPVDRLVQRGVVVDDLREPSGRLAADRAARHEPRRLPAEGGRPGDGDRVDVRTSSTPPGTTLSTPSGSPASAAASASTSAPSGASGSGTSTTVFPHASAGATRRTTAGSAPVTSTPNTPTGRGAAPKPANSSLSAQPAHERRCAATADRSSRARRTGAPGVQRLQHGQLVRTVRHHLREAEQQPRAPAGSVPQSTCARRAAATARSTSAGPAVATSASRSPVAGFRTVSGSPPPTYRPSTNGA